ncbi:MAG: phosphomannomutase [Armatimonadetes bacterium]|nr:phosphomannomutase [Armatimonadota bacterium]
MTSRLGCFKTYDIRGRVPDELYPRLAYRIGRAFAAVLRPRTVAVGRDMRLSSPGLAEGLTQGLLDSGVDVLDLGMIGTELVYFATFHQELDGGIMVTASHNPAEYNGMKLVGRQAVPLDAAVLGEIERRVREGGPERPSRIGRRRSADDPGAYFARLGELVPPGSLPRLRVVCNAGNGAVGPLLSQLMELYPELDLLVLNPAPDGTFPAGVPNPLLPENREETARAVRKFGADLGVAWDGDYDRCFLFDEHGGFIEGYYLVGLIAESVLENEPGATILYDPRLTWNTEELVLARGGNPIMCRTGHAFFKQEMRARQAAYGGEMSGHHYFREFGNCDSGILPWLLVMRMLRERPGLSRLVESRQRRYPISGEINRAVADPALALKRVRDLFLPEAAREHTLDGVTMEFADWRFNLRSSNTEPLLRLNVETRGDPALLAARTEEILALLDGDALRGEDPI